MPAVCKPQQPSHRLASTLLDCLISQEERKWLSYPAANLRFIKGESRKKNPSAVSFNSAASQGELLWPNQSFLRLSLVDVRFASNTQSEITQRKWKTLLF